ncbi:MAG: hypothetical protein CSA55_01520 [Ilumatobacter coccineus]|uniref:Endolytic murein transglycosylase n=1 Tax=Ilumatobacter coccineus TaxID=467094 RepID=A0A2G6KF05_9ACTN|nr:MAG: hypothetical protein CSA55_01520 [Ilumatobacter coccineus]
MAGFPSSSGFRVVITSSEAEWSVDEWDHPGEVPEVERLRQEHRLLKWIVWLAMAVVVALIISAGAVGWWYLGKTRAEPLPEDVIAFTVVESDSVEAVSDRLETLGLITDAGVFEWYVERQGGIELTPGFYEIPTGAHMGDVLQRLRTSPAETYQKITFPEGFTIVQMAERLAEKSPRLSVEGFIAAANSLTVPSQYRREGELSLEGLLFPDTYRVSNADNEAQIVERMVKIGERVAQQEDLVDGAAKLGLTPYEVIIVASMIEKEAKLDADRPKIARVIYNRLEDGMKLQIDATMLYGAPEGASISDLIKIESPYNTYVIDGLPPTPISNPGRASLRAALNPAPNPPAGDPVCQVLPNPTIGCRYLYYVLANEDGGHAFAVTAEQHLANVERARSRGLLG